LCVAFGVSLSVEVQTLSRRHQFRLFAWWVLSYTVLVIVWGAYVRATGSGAGCGDHWPLCNGEVIPRDPSLERMVEFSHRLTSGLSLALIVGLFFWSRRLYPAGHVVRLASAMSLVFIIGEALVGAALVILQLVGGNDSVLRAVVIAGHLVNTFLLLYWLAKVVYVTDPLIVEKKLVDKRLARIFRICLGGFVIAGAVGAIVALGDTLFPAESLSQALSEEFSATAHFLVRLRVWHPLVAVGVSAYILAQCLILPHTFKGQVAAKAGMLVAGLVLLQLLGVPMQLFHLALADVTWIALCFWYFSTQYNHGEQA
jgi:heme A synthase